MNLRVETNQGFALLKNVLNKVYSIVVHLQ